MKHSVILTFALVLLVGCQPKIDTSVLTIEMPELGIANDSMNYAAAYAYGYQTRLLLRRDTTPEAMTECVLSLRSGVKGEQTLYSPIEEMGQALGWEVRQWEKTGLAGNSSWNLNEGIYFQGLVNGILGHHYSIDEESARAFLEEEFTPITSNAQPLPAKEPIKSKCPKSAKEILPSNASDSLNYLLGLLKGEVVAIQMKGRLDSSIDHSTELFAEINKGLESKAINPILSYQLNQLGVTMSLSDRLLGLEMYLLDYDIFEAGFIAGIQGTEGDAENWGEYIHNTARKAEEE